MKGDETPKCHGLLSARPFTLFQVFLSRAAWAQPTSGQQAMEMAVGPRRAPAVSRLGGEGGGGEQKETNVSGQITTPESTITQKACGRGKKKKKTKNNNTRFVSLMH